MECEETNRNPVKFKEEKQHNKKIHLLRNKPSSVDTRNVSIVTSLGQLYILMLCPYIDNLLLPPIYLVPRFSTRRVKTEEQNIKITTNSQPGIVNTPHSKFYI